MKWLSRTKILFLLLNVFGAVKIVPSLEDEGLDSLADSSHPFLLKVDQPNCKQCAEIDVWWDSVANDYSTVSARMRNSPFYNSQSKAERICPPFNGKQH